MNSGLTCACGADVELKMLKDRDSGMYTSHWYCDVCEAKVKEPFTKPGHHNTISAHQEFEHAANLERFKINKIAMEKIARLRIK